jgi:hypothetical protein
VTVISVNKDDFLALFDAGKVFAFKAMVRSSIIVTESFLKLSIVVTFGDGD